MVRDPMAHWTRGNVTLLGDACHPTLPFLAQGAAMAIEDGYLLARALDEYRGNPGEALQRYEDMRKERTSRMVEGSNANAKRFHNRELAHPEGAAAYVNREWQEERVKERYEWLFTYDVDTVPI
jgi:salicylate hydroxylase